MNADQRYLKKIKAAHLIYKENLALQDVAKILGVSRPTLKKLIEEMLQEGIVTIQIKYPASSQYNIQAGFKLASRYKLRDAIVATAPSSEPEEIMDRIGIVGADYLQDCLSKNMAIGSTGGRTIYSLVSYLVNDPQVTGLQVYATTGGSLYANTKYHSNTVVQRIADIYRGTGNFIYAPTYADNRAQREMLLNNSQIRQTLERCKSVEIALTGIADAKSALSYLPQPIEALVDAKAMKELAGAVNTLLIDKKGRPLSCPATELFIGLGYEDLKKVGTVIALAGGAQKHAAIKAALLGGYVDVLITDQFTADYLLS